MAISNQEIDYEAELRNLRKVYTEHWSQGRLNVIRLRLKDSLRESGAVRLVTLVTCVEALARSLLVSSANPKTMTDFLRAYRPIERSDPGWLVTELLRLRGITSPATHFKEDTWQLFGYAVEFRNFIVHEAAYLGQDKSPSLHQATDEVLRELVRLGDLKPF